MNEDILIGKRYKLNDPNNTYDGIILTVSHIDDYVVRYKDAPFETFGSGTEYFRKYWKLMED